MWYKSGDLLEQVLEPYQGRAVESLAAQKDPFHNYHQYVKSPRS